jgi:L-lactate dehydrogenase complex protein LldG
MAEARQAILDAVARARTAAAAVTPADPDSYRVAPTAETNIVALLIERLRDYKADVHDVRTAGRDPVAVRTVLENLLDTRVTRVVVPAEFPIRLRPRTPDVIEDVRGERALTASQLDEIDAAITTSAAAIATTGTILLDHTGAQGRRVVSLVPDIHVVLVHEADIYAEVPAAVRALGPRPLLTWISGPSATSDIELNRVEGVHGPRALIVIIHRAGP